ncbi:MAG: bifunctional ornithine acetyltransferase/N-acetylglutamate synthase, partial [Clostridia bacterium]|nr:bifunctional ornithine acetyltransferase/N-acetylglutamate synthase [Clostridia bacterium]
MKIERIAGGVTAAKGFKAACCAAGIKYQGRTDMAMIASDVPCGVAGTFTTNVVKAAPVVWDRQIVQTAKAARAVVVNAGIANAATGAAGMAMCEQTAACVARALGVP